MNVFDVFTNSAFSMVSLTDAVNKMPYVPGRAGRLGIFEESGINTTTVVIEEKDGVLYLVENTPRGAPAKQNTKSKRKARSLIVPHLPVEDKVMADEIQGVRAFGTPDQLASVQQVVMERFGTMIPSLDATVEYGRIGAIKGIIYDADGSSVIYNLFTEFGVTQTSVDFVLGTGTTNVKAKCLAVKRAIEDEMGMAVYDHVHCFAGKDWFDKFVEHDKVKAAYERYQEGRVLREDNRRGFEFAGIWFEEYPGKVGSVDFVAAGEAHFFPVGVPGLFKTRYAPADFVETANTIGLPRYAKQAVDQRFGQFVDLHAQANPLSYCTRPKVLVNGTTSN